MIKNHFIRVSLALCIANTIAFANQIDSNKGGGILSF